MAVSTVVGDIYITQDKIYEQTIKQTFSFRGKKEALNRVTVQTTIPLCFRARMQCSNLKLMRK